MVREEHGTLSNKVYEPGTVLCVYVIMCVCVCVCVCTCVLARYFGSYANCCISLKR